MGGREGVALDRGTSVFGVDSAPCLRLGCVEDSDWGVMGIGIGIEEVFNLELRLSWGVISF